MRVLASMVTSGRTGHAIARGATTWTVFAAILVLLSGCAWGQGRRSAVMVVPGGNPQEGQVALVRYGCTSCHVIPGVAGPDAHVGPPLDNFAQRAFIGGVAPNSTDNLVLWLQNPQAVNALTAMPATGVTEQDARHIAAYLYLVD